MKRHMGDQAKWGVPHPQDQATGEYRGRWNGSDFCKLVHK